MRHMVQPISTGVSQRVVPAGVGGSRRGRRSYLGGGATVHAGRIRVRLQRKHIR